MTQRPIKFRALPSGKAATASWLYWELLTWRPVYIEQDTISQFTGLLDKNGVEIYEGDVCKTKAWDHPVKIEWNPVCAGFQMSDEKNEFWEDLHVSDEYEVVGNIHQHPELLK